MGFDKRASVPGFYSWQAMKIRCYVKSTKDYHRYGGRGITVCQRWREDFNAFLEDMGSPPFRGAMLERLDNDRGYEPGNCVWAGSRAQARNKVTSLKATVAGETLILTDWAARLGVGKDTLNYRRRVFGSLEAAIRSFASTPVSHANKLVKP